MKEQLKVGDEVFHKTAPSVIWLIDNIDGQNAVCTNFNPATMKYTSQGFPLSSLQKKLDPTPPQIRDRSNMW